MMPETDTSIVQAFRYRISGLHAIVACLVGIPGFSFMIYTPFMNPCSPDRKSGDCSLGSPLAEEFYKYGFVCFGILGILICLNFARKVLKIKTHRKGYRIAFTSNSIIGPLWHSWNGKEGEIYFSEITKLSLEVGRHFVYIDVNSIDKKMVLKNNFLERDSFIKIYNILAKNLNKESFDVAASNEFKSEFASTGVKLGYRPHLWVSIAFAIIGIFLTTWFESYEGKYSDTSAVIGMLLSGTALVLIVFNFKEKILKSDLKTKFGFCFLMLFGFFTCTLGISRFLAFIDSL